MQVSLALLNTVALHRLRMGSTILLPVIGMIVTPLAGTVPTDLPILRILQQLLLAILLPALVLASRSGAHPLLRMKSRGRKRLVAERAQPRRHAIRLTADGKRMYAAPPAVLSGAAA